MIWITTRRFSIYPPMGRAPRMRVWFGSICTCGSRGFYMSPCSQSGRRNIPTSTMTSPITCEKVCCRPGSGCREICVLSHGNFVGKDICYRYSVDGQDKKTRMFEKVVLEAVEAPECFSVESFADDYSKQEFECLQRLAEALRQNRS